MARHSRRYRRSRARSLAGGSYSSAATYGEYVNGSGGSQWTRTMDQGGAYGQVPGNVIIGAQGQNVQPASMAPSQANLALIQKAGRRRRRGGFLGEVVNQAIVPVALLGMQQTYRRKRGGRKNTRRHRRH
jgi:hypothetical protein